MFRSYVVTAIRILSRNRLDTFIKVFGLAIGLAAFLLIALYVQYELSFDAYHENADRMYRVVREERVLTPAPLGPALAQNFADIEAVARIIQDPDTLVSRGDANFLEQAFYWADPDLFQVFSPVFTHGDPETALRQPFSVVISQSAALKYFGDADPLGETLNINDRNDFEVTGVFADMPANSHFVVDVVVPYEDYFKLTDNDITRWQSNFTYTYFLLQEGADPTTLENDIHRVIEGPLFERFGVPEPYPELYFVQPVRDIHLKSHRMQEISVNNDMVYIVLFASIAVLILFIACINYVNLATARATRRGREVGMRKVVGARRGQLVQQFMVESLVLILLALALTMFIVALVLPEFNNLVERELGMAAMFDPYFLSMLATTVALVALLAGGYPALNMSALKPVTILKGALSKGRQAKILRNVLVLFQFTISIVLFICTLTISRQLDFVNAYDVGYSKSGIINLTIRDSAVRRNIDAVKTELMQHPGVLSVAASARLPNNIDTFTNQVLNPLFPDEATTIFYNTADYDFVDLYGIGIRQGRNFSRELPSDEQGVFLVNEAAVRAADWVNPLEQMLTHWSGETGPVVGVMKDFHLHSLHSPVAPLYVYLDPHNFAYLSVRIEPDDIPATLEYLEQVMRKFSPNFPFEYTFFDQAFAETYHPEQRMVNIFSAFALLAIAVACLGLFGLSAFTAQQRTREISIRKVLGASVASITMLLSREFVRWVVLANLVAWPLAYLAMDRWLQNFAMQVEQSLLVYLASALLAFVIALLTVGTLAVKAAMARPGAALQHE